ncbi:PH domain-containing protein [Exiguobacterium sp. TDN 0502]|uniref:PH domain-containing protein n=1 Tax=Exiguobacterium sp. TDN 0502 TaxID=3420731 RepID=UPI003D788F9B
MTRRVHPLFILMSSISTIRSLLIPFAALILNAIRKGEINSYTWIGISVGILFVILYGIASWYFYTFTIDAETIRVRKGIVKKSERTTQRKRIESIGIQQNVIERLLRLATLTVETSSESGSPEVELKGIRLDFAKELKSSIKNDGPIVAKEESEEIAYTIPVRDLALAGALSGRVGLALVGIGTAYQFIDQFIERYVDRLFSELAHLSLIVLTGLGILVLLIIYIGSIIVYILKYGAYRAVLQHNRLLIGYGMLNRTEVAFHADKIQALVIQESWIQRLIGRASLSLHIISATGEKERLLLHPFIRTNEIDGFLATYLPRFRQFTPQYEVAAKGFRYRVRWPLIGYALLFTTLSSVVSIVLDSSWRFLILLLFIWLPLYFFAVRSGYKKTRFGTKHDLLMLRKHWIQKETVYTPRLKIEELTWSVSRFLEAKEIAKIQVHLRGNTAFNALYFKRSDIQQLQIWYKQSFLSDPLAGEADQHDE